MRRRLTDSEVDAIARNLVHRPRPAATVDIGVLITRATDELPSVNDIQRVQQRLGELSESTHLPGPPRHDAESREPGRF